MSRTPIGHCDCGWTCEEHEGQPRGHDGCTGAGEQCPNPNCPWWKDDPPRALEQWRKLDVVYASTSQEPTQKTGLVCPLCKQAYGAIEAQEAKHIAFKRQACGHRWRWDDPWPDRS